MLLLIFFENEFPNNSTDQIQLNPEYYFMNTLWFAVYT